jgi:hypothetical protein
MIRNIVIGAAGLVAIILVAPQILPAPSTPGRIAAPTGPSQGEPTPAARAMRRTWPHRPRLRAPRFRPGRRYRQSIGFTR